MDQNTCSEPEMEIKVDFDAFDRNLKETLFELQSKRILLDECRQKLNESILNEQDLERQLIKEKHKNTKEEYDRIVLQNGAEALEEETQKCSKELIKLKVQVKLAVAERDSLRDQVQSKCLENTNLKRQVEDLSSKHRPHNQKELSEQLFKLKVSINQINDSMILLKQKLEAVENMFDTNNVLKQLQVATNQFKKQKTIAEKERNEIENQLVIKSAELSKLQQLLENSPDISPTVDTDIILNYWKETCQDLEYKLRIEKDGTESLTNTIKYYHEYVEDLREKQLKDEKIIAELEELLKCDEPKIHIETQTETNKDFIEIVDLVKSEPEN